MHRCGAGESSRDLPHAHADRTPRQCVFFDSTRGTKPQGDIGPNRKKRISIFRLRSGNRCARRERLIRRLCHDIITRRTASYRQKEKVASGVDRNPVFPLIRGMKLLLPLELARSLHNGERCNWCVPRFPTRGGGR